MSQSSNSMFSRLPRNKKIYILGGGPGLGFYVPGLILKHQLRELGYTTHFQVYESYLKKEKLQRLPGVMSKFHESFKAALISQKLAKPVDHEFDEELLMQVFQEWQSDDASYFISFSGHWIPILEGYSRYIGSENFTALLCHIDVVNSTSWSLYEPSLSAFEHVWFTSWKDKKVSYLINVDNEGVLPVEDRSDRFLIHGGGWGMGTYLEKIDVLNKAGIPLDILLYTENDRKHVESNDNEFYLIDPEWKYWNKSGEEHVFPPLKRIKNGKAEAVTGSHRYPAIYSVLKRNKAIISKPGAGTLLDSMSSATPLVILEPFGTYEKLNGELWQELGFGITLEAWKASGFSLDIFNELHANLCRYRKNVINFLLNYHEDQR